MTKEEIERYLHLNYIVIVGDSATDLEKKVDEVSTRKPFGEWEPIGGIAVTYADSVNDYPTVMFYQAMRKKPTLKDDYAALKAIMGSGQ